MKLLRAIRTDGRTLTDSLSAAAVRDIVRKRGRMIGIPDLAPHDLRRTFARLSREGGAPLETIQHALGHASVQTTERYTRTGLEANAGDYIQLKTKGTETK
jgi:integrase